MQVEWLRQRVGDEAGPVLRLLEWVGVAVDQPKENLEPILRFKSMLLVAIAIKQRATRWLHIHTQGLLKARWCIALYSNLYIFHQIY